MMEIYSDKWFEYLEILKVNATYVFCNINEGTFSVLKIGNAPNLYFGHARITNEILISNRPEIVKKFCYDIVEIDYDCYFKSNELINTLKSNQNKLLSLSKKNK